jgi:hypothetical protein
MNGKQLACIVLLMIVGAVTYAAQIVHKKAEAAFLAAQEVQLEAEAAAGQTEVSNIALQKAKSESQDLQRFLTAWTPQIQRLGTRQEVEEAVQANTRDKGVFVVSQRFEDKSHAGERMMPRSVLASLTLEDDYSKVMNWLGELEKKIPLARVTSCRISSASTGRQVHMEVALEVPLIDLGVNPLGVTEKKKKGA